MPCIIVWRRDYHLHFYLNFSNKSQNIPPFFHMEKSCMFLHGWTWYLYATYLLLWHLLKCPLHTLIHAHRVMMLDFVIIYRVCYSFSSFSVSRFYRRRTKKHWSFAKPCIKEESAPLLWLFLILARGTCLFFLSFFQLKFRWFKFPNKNLTPLFRAHYKDLTPIPKKY